MSAHLLLLDGPPEPRHLCRDVLERAGYQVRHAADARDAIAQVRSEPPEAILLIAEETDLFHRLVQALRLHPATSRLPILVISPTSAREVREILEAARPIGWLEAPFTPRRLLDEVHYVTRPGIAGPRTRRTGPAEAIVAEPVGRRWSDLDEWRDERMRRTWGGLRRSPSGPVVRGGSDDSWFTDPAVHPASESPEEDASDQGPFAVVQ